ncbi:MAG: hypothetical protein ACHBN1_15205 [Heteroscytonema crispum UTEX LB 1556]
MSAHQINLGRSRYIQISQILSRQGAKHEQTVHPNTNFQLNN